MNSDKKRLDWVLWLLKNYPGNWSRFTYWGSCKELSRESIDKAMEYDKKEQVKLLSRKIRDNQNRS